MTDIALRFDPLSLEFDVLIQDGDLATDDGLYTSGLVSIFTDREDDEPAAPGADRGGWWGDAFADVAGDRIGSRLWKLKRQIIDPDVMKLATDYVRESMVWMITDGIAGAIEVTAERQDPHTVAFAIVITRPDGRTHRYDYVWSSLDGV